MTFGISAGTAALIGGAIAAGGAVAGSAISSHAAGNIAQAQQSAAQQTQTQALSYAGATPAELEAQSNQLGIATTSLQYATQQMGQYAAMQGSLSPTFTQAFGQIRDILGGAQTGLTAPAFAQFDIQRQQQANQMQQAFGGGAASSTAGIQANALFGQQQGMLAMGVDTNALNALQGLGMNAGSLYQSLGQAGTNALGAASAANQGYAGMLGNIQNRSISALEGTNITPYAGANNVGALGMGNMLSGLGGTAQGTFNNMNAANNTQALMGMFANSSMPAGTGGGGFMPGAVPATPQQFSSGFTPSGGTNIGQQNNGVNI